jgi:hypothetical protein
MLILPKMAFLAFLEELVQMPEMAEMAFVHKDITQ